MSTSQKIITGEAVLSYPHFLEPQAPQNGKGDPKFGCMLVFAEGATDAAGQDLLAALQAAVIAIAQEAFGANAIKMLKGGQLKNPIGTNWELKGLAENSFYLNPKSKTRPGLVQAWNDPATGKPMRVPEDQIEAVFYPGAKVRASISLYPYTYTEGGSVVSKGVGVGLNNVQKLGDGPRIDGRKAADEEFTATQELQPAELDDIG